MLPVVVGMSLAIMACIVLASPEFFFRLQGVPYTNSGVQGKAELRAFYAGTCASISYMFLTGSCGCDAVCVLIGTFVMSRLWHRSFNPCQTTVLAQDIVLFLELGVLLAGLTSLL